MKKSVTQKRNTVKKVKLKQTKDMLENQNSMKHKHINITNTVD